VHYTLLDLHPWAFRCPRASRVLLSRNERRKQVLALSLKTVQNHISNIFSKLQVVDRAQAIVRAREAGLGAG
jgi:DNA-binding CsgD family transcriptional regulator